MKTLIDAVLIFSFQILMVIDLPALSTADDVNGKLLIGLRMQNGNYTVTSVAAVPGVEPVELDCGNTCYRILDGVGRVLGKGKLYIPTHIVHERAGDGGRIDGVVRPFTEPITVTLPRYSRASRIELLRDGCTILSYQLNRKAIRRITKTAAPRSNDEIRPDFRGYINELKRRRIKLTEPAVEPDIPNTRPTKKVKVTGKVTVKGVNNYNLVSALISFYPRGGTYAQVQQVYSTSSGSFSISLDEGKYLVQATCWYFDPAYGSRAVMLYPSPLLISDYDTDNGPIAFRWKLNRLLKGQVVTKAGKQIRGQIYVLERKFSGSTFHPLAVSLFFTDAVGNFAIRLPGKRFAMIVLPDADQPAGELLKIVKVKKTKKTTKLVCPDLESKTGSSLKKIWDSGPESKKLNLVFLAEAYTAGLEKFTDKNKNGYWDGDLLLDENGNGKLDSGEYYYDRNRDGKYSKPEKFKDKNGDGICNRYERAKFEADCAVNAAAFLNFYPINKCDGRINIYTYWTASKHGVQTFTKAAPWKNMNTAFGSYCSSTGGFQPGALNTDTKAFVAQLLPGAKETVPIVMVHDPFNAMRSNAGLGFGRVLQSAEDNRGGATLIHELGHSIGSLWDEYIYSGASGSPNFEPSAANVTTVTNLSQVKWKEFIKGSPPVPTPSFYEGYGLFEGAGSYTKGIYRPTFTSMMRSTSYPFFSVNSKRMRQVLEQFEK